MFRVRAKGEELAGGCRAGQCGDNGSTIACHTLMLQALCAALCGFLGLRSLESLLILHRKANDLLKNDRCPCYVSQAGPELLSTCFFSQVLGPQVCTTTSGDVRHSSGVGVQGVLVQKSPVEKVLTVPRVWAHLFFWVQK